MEEEERGAGVGGAAFKGKREKGERRGIWQWKEKGQARMTPIHLLHTIPLPWEP